MIAMVSQDWEPLLQDRDPKCFLNEQVNECVCTTGSGEIIPPSENCLLFRRLVLMYPELLTACPSAMESISWSAFWHWYMMPCFMGNSLGTARKSEVRWECVKCEVSCQVSQSLNSLEICLSLFQFICSWKRPFIIRHLSLKDILNWGNKPHLSSEVFYLDRKAAESKCFMMPEK